MKVKRQRLGRVSQGDVYKDVEFIQDVSLKRGNIEKYKIVFPYVVVLTQDCDLIRDSEIRYHRIITQTQDKLIISVLVAPLYNVEHVYMGQHLENLKIKMQLINKNRTSGKNLRDNKNPRYHYLEFPSEIPITPSVIDFKHYFSVNVEYLKSIKKESFICRISDLFKEDISFRFANFLSRVGLP